MEETDLFGVEGLDVMQAEHGLEPFTQRLELSTHAFVQRPVDHQL